MLFTVLPPPFRAGQKIVLIAPEFCVLYHCTYDCWYLNSTEINKLNALCNMFDCFAVENMWMKGLEWFSTHCLSVKWTTTAINIRLRTFSVFCWTAELQIKFCKTGGLFLYFNAELDSHISLVSVFSPTISTVKVNGEVGVCVEQSLCYTPCIPVLTMVFLCLQETIQKSVSEETPKPKRSRKKNKMPILSRYGKRSKKRRRSSNSTCSVIPSTSVRPPMASQASLSSPQPSPTTPQTSPHFSAASCTG